MLALTAVCGEVAAQTATATATATPALGVAQAAQPAAAPVENKLIPSPRPGAVEAETAHIARYDAAIAAAREQTISGADAERLKQALAKV